MRWTKRSRRRGRTRKTAHGALTPQQQYDYNVLKTILPARGLLLRNNTKQNKKYDKRGSS